MGPTAPPTLCPGLPALSELPPDLAISRNPSLKRKLLNFPVQVYVGEERRKVELCPVLQSPHMKRKRLEVHLHEKRLSSCVWGGGGAYMGHGVIVGEFFPLNMFVLSFHNEQTPLQDKFMSSVVGEPPPPRTSPGQTCRLPSVSFHLVPRQTQVPASRAGRPLALTPPSHPCPGDPRARGGAAPRTKKPPDPTDPRL